MILIEEVEGKFVIQAAGLVTEHDTIEELLERLMELTGLT